MQNVGSQLRREGKGREGMATEHESLATNANFGDGAAGELKASFITRIYASICDMLELAVVKLALGKKNEVSCFLSGNYAPVSESKPRTSLPIAGALPACLNGEFVRVGPNPKFKPVAAYNWFDGDGMLHGLRIKDGAATYVSRYVKTSRLKQEEFYGAAKFLKIGDLRGLVGILFSNLYTLRKKLGILDDSSGVGTGNTALIYHNGKVLALHEADTPYVVKLLEDGDLETVGRLDYEKNLNHPFTAHPKVDPVTGELFFFGYQFEPPYLTYRTVSKEGALRKPVTITIPEAVMIHDFAITENYAIFMDLPLFFRPQNLIQGKLIISYEPTVNSRFGLLPRYAKDELQIRWFELPPCYIFHTVNAWEEEDEVVLFACRMPSFDFEVTIDCKKDYHSTPPNELFEFRFNVKSGAAVQKKLSEGSVDFPRINEKYVGRKHRYAYACVFENPTEIRGIVKFDLHEEPKFSKEFNVGGNVQGVFWFGPDRYGSEAVFVPTSNDKEALEDDGYLLCFVYDKKTRKSEVIVIDAKTMASEPIAVISLPVRVPYGFHAIFVTEEQLGAQRLQAY
ncbi:hypothetical protein O6H91_01G076300 [Diphasiastrum complanatum]|uniref:Uncharacterized protein n=1 Tax=Diphasiastrum complanatum TaxID=34168 RepID=A0ACC2ES93_DIPCM|nr:hypothetical protein O6H91_01G076300 [Diphasiastrum complanatum]